MSSQIPESIAAALLKPSETIPDTAISVQGPDFDKGMSLQDLLHSYERIGFQATSFGRAIDIINRMVCSVFCAHTSNLSFFSTRFSENGVHQKSLSR